jgi:hypothetical protein
VPNRPGSNYKIVVIARDAAGNFGEDASDGTFEIAEVPTIQYLSFSGAESQVNFGGDPNLVGWSISLNEAILYLQVNSLGLMSNQKQYGVDVAVYSYYTPMQDVNRFTISAYAGSIFYVYKAVGLAAYYKVEFGVDIYTLDGQLLARKTAFSKDRILYIYMSGSESLYPSISATFDLHLQKGNTYKIVYWWSVVGNSVYANFFFNGDSRYGSGPFSDSYSSFIISSPQIRF